MAPGHATARCPHLFLCRGAALSFPQIEPVALLWSKQAPLIGQRTQSSVAEAWLSTNLCQSQQTPGNPCRAMGEAREWYVLLSRLPSQTLRHGLSVSEQVLSTLQRRLQNVL